jgi:pyruvate kinase
VWGVHPIVTKDATTSTTWSSAPANREPRRLREVRRARLIVAGMPFGTPGATNMLRIAYLGAE